MGPRGNPLGTLSDPPTEPPWNPLWTPGGTPCARALPDAEYEPPPNDRKPMQAQLDNHQSPEWNLPKVPARGGLVAWQCLCLGRCVCVGRASNNDARYTQEQNKLHAVRPAIGARTAGDATPVAREAAQRKSLIWISFMPRMELLRWLWTDRRPSLRYKTLHNTGGSSPCRCCALSTF